MPTITIKNGNRTLKLTKRETDVLGLAKDILLDIQQDYKPLEKDASDAAVAIGGIFLNLYGTATPTANGKPADAGTAGK